MCEQSSFSGSSVSSPEEIARRKEFNRVLKFDIAFEEVNDEKYDVMIGSSLNLGPSNHRAI